MCLPLSASSEQGPQGATTGHAFSVCPNPPLPGADQTLLGAVPGAWAGARALAGPLGHVFCSSCSELVPHSYAHGAEKSSVFWRWDFCGISVRMSVFSQVSKCLAPITGNTLSGQGWRRPVNWAFPSVHSPPHSWLQRPPGVSGA